MKEDIKRLIPQREPILMVDKLVSVENDSATTCLTVRQGLYFVDEEGVLTEPGLIEHIAQSASAFAGWKALESGRTNPPVGYIGEVKKFCCFRCPKIGEELHTVVVMGAEVSGVTALTGETRVEDEVIATTQMKIFVQDKETAED